ncbi:unnamed protein product [Cuscuta europaea]|uniref:SWIM-type domain-containing protein n=1 Tax=Cuscuta europaea TaxID=41803 RepID=A0A9P0Z7F7_CUSEU|nr:unnamed protein product [Cuscuta europaea]
MDSSTVITIKMWHGGIFKNNNLKKLEYVDGEYKCFEIDADELCWFWLEELAGNYGKCSSIDDIYYLIPGQSLQNGLRRVKLDDEVRKMYKVAMKYKIIDCYIRHGLSSPELVLLLEGGGENEGGATEKWVNDGVKGSSRSSAAVSGTEPITRKAHVLFQVCHRLDCLTVNLEARTCTCRKWDLSGIPCCHAISCIFFMNETPENYVHTCYTKDTYLKMYSGGIAPLTGERHWPKVDMPIDPPPIKIGPGRPRKSRMKSPHENPKKPGKLTKHDVEMSCSVCKSKDHNKRKCPDKNKEAQPVQKKSRDRPKKAIQNAEAQQSTYQTTAQPTRIGRGGRLIQARGGSNTTGRGSRPGETRGRGRFGRGRGKGQISVDFGVFVDGEGNTWTNPPGQAGPSYLSEPSVGPSFP